VGSVTVTLAGLDEMQRALEKLAKRGLATAARETLTGMAWAGRPIWQGRLASANILRNQFTARRVLVAPATGSSMRDMTASLGHVSDYVAELERGEGDTARGSAVPIPEAAARGGDRKRLVRKASKLSTIGRLPTKRPGKSMRARNAFALRKAIKGGKRLAVLEGAHSVGIFKVTGRKKLKVKKLWDLSHREVSRPRRPTLEATVRDVHALAPAIAHRAMSKQLRLLGAK
jgi:hypothetical protein